MVAESYTEHGAIKQYCGGGGARERMMRQMTVRIDQDTMMLVHSRDICAKRPKATPGFSLVKKNVPVVILRYGSPKELEKFKAVDATLAKSGYTPVVFTNKSGDELRSEFEKLRVAKPMFASQDLRAIVQGDGGISKDDQQHFIGIETPAKVAGQAPTAGVVKTAEDIIAPFEVLTGRTHNCAVLVDSCYSGQVVHDVTKPTKPNDYLGPNGNVAVASGVNSSRVDIADDGTVLNYMLSMSDVDSPDRAAADANRDGSVSLDEASSYLGDRGGIHHPRMDGDPAFYERFNLKASSWIGPDTSQGPVSPQMEERLKTDETYSRAEIEQTKASSADSATKSISNVNSGMFVGGSREASEMTLFPLPVEEATPAPIYGDSQTQPADDLQTKNPDQRE